MQPRILIACHGPLAAAFKASAELILGEQERIVAAPPYSGDMDELERALRSSLDAVGPEGRLVVLTDLLGGSVNTRLATVRDERITLIAGANLGLLLEVATTLTDPDDTEAVAAIVGRASDGLQVVDPTADTREDDF